MKKIFPWVCLIAIVPVVILLVAMGIEILLLDQNPVVISGLAVGVAVCLLVILAYAFWQAMGQK